jgi:hypothetical protein
MVKCCRLEVFKARIASLEWVDNDIVISVVENLLCDAVKDATGNDEYFNHKLEKVIKYHLYIIKESATKHPGTKFTIVRPTLRPAHKW